MRKEIQYPTLEPRNAELADGNPVGYPSDNEGPDNQEECTQKGHEQHYKLFVRRIIEPILDNVPKPAVKDLAEEMGLARKQASNYLITARRRYHRLLRQEIGKYATTDEEVTLEIEDLFKFVAGA